MATQAQRAAARLTAFRLIEAAQVHESADALAVAHREARDHDWPEVERVLLYADVVRAQFGDHPRLGDAITRLQELAERDGDHAMVSAALASRSEMLFGSGVPADLQRSDDDLAQATALLDIAEGGALEQATAYVACAVAYSVRELWEIEEELYEAATPILAECEIPVLDAVVLFNRAEASLRLLCGLHEVNDPAGLHRVGPLAEAAAAAAVAGPMPAAWTAEARVFQHLVSALLRGRCTVPSDELWAATAADMSLRTTAVAGLVHLADALCAAHAGDWDAAAEHSELAVTMSTDEFASSARALAMRIAARAEASLGVGAAPKALRYAEHSARRRWRARVQILGSARAGLQASRLRIERDRHARASLVDDLTGLANRRGYSHHLQTLRRRRSGRPLAVLLLDIDDFKHVNDTHGHHVGDQVLARVAAALAGGTRGTDLVARLGGDEFVALLDDFDTTAAHRRARDLLASLAATSWDALAPGLDLAVSIGVAADTPGGDAEDLVRRADAALYAAKARGGGTVEVERSGLEGAQDKPSRVRRPPPPRP